MFKKISAILLVAVLSFSLAISVSAAVPETPETEVGFYAADFAGILSEETEALILVANQTIRKEYGAEIVVVTVDYTEGKDIADYAAEIGNDWGIGSSKYNNGMVLLLSVGADNYYVATGNGFNSKVGDIKTLLDTVLEPDFAAKNYDKGVLNCFNALVALVKESNVGGADFKDQSFEEFRNTAAGGMSSGKIGTASAIAILIVMFILFALVFGFMFSAGRRVQPGPMGMGMGRRMPLWPIMFLGSRSFMPFGGFGPRGPGGFGGGGFGGGGGSFGGGGAGRG